MNKLFSILLLTILITGCAAGPSPSVPTNYKGPVSSIQDSYKKHSASKTDFFYLEKVGENSIENSRSKTLADNYGQGFSMNPVALERKVPAKKSTLHIVGRTEYAAPILALSNPVYEIKGDISFTPKPNVKYVVAGALSPTYSAVWIEEAASKKVVSNKVSKKGSAALGFFQK